MLNNNSIEQCTIFEIYLKLQHYFISFIINEDLVYFKGHKYYKQNIRVNLKFV
jgi:hypothetical protein